MPRLTYEQLKVTPEFLDCTPQQQLFIATYISNGYDPINAVRTAYKCKNDRSAKSMCYETMKKSSVMVALMTHFQEDPKDFFSRVLLRAVKSGSITPEQLRGYELYAEIQGWRKKQTRGGGRKPSVKALDSKKDKKKAEKTADTYDLSDFEKK